MEDESISFQHCLRQCMNFVSREVTSQQNKLVPTNIVQLVASSVVNRHDDIEFYEWASADTSYSIWSCHDIFKSPMIENAIKRLIKKSSNSEAASTLLCEKDRKT